MLGSLASPSGNPGRTRRSNGAEAERNSLMARLLAERTAHRIAVDRHRDQLMALQQSMRAFGSSLENINLLLKQHDRILHQLQSDYVEMKRKERMTRMQEMQQQIQKTSTAHQQAGQLQGKKHQSDDIE